MNDCERMEMYTQLRPYLKQIDMPAGYGKLEKTVLINQMRNDLIRFKAFVEGYKEVMYEEREHNDRGD